MERYTLAVVDYLQTQPDVRDVRVSRPECVTEAKLREWERVNAPCVLPGDLRAFLTRQSNGLHVKWSVALGDAGVVEIGDMCIHGIEDLTAVPLDASPPDDPWSGSGGHGVPELGKCTDSKSSPSQKAATAAFDLGGAGTNGRVALVFLRDLKSTRDHASASASHASTTTTSSTATATSTNQVWFQDPAGVWHVLAENFSEYFQMTHANLGLPSWHHRLTPSGLHPYAMKWWHWMAPETLALDIEKGKLRRVEDRR
jgi:hypothetical protein